MEKEKYQEQKQDNPISLGLIKILKREGYTNITLLEGKGVCGLKRFAFTTGLVHGLTEVGYSGRWCFHNYKDALDTMKEWEIMSETLSVTLDNPDNEHWIKYKGLEKHYGNFRHPDFNPVFDVKEY